MKKINFAEVKENAVAKVKEIGENVKTYIEDHPEGIFWTVLVIGTTVSYGQSIRYMHLLNNSAKEGTFKFIPGQGYVA